MKRREFLQTAGLAAIGTAPAIADKTTTGRVYAAHQKFSQQVVGWTAVSEYAHLKARLSSHRNHTQGVE